MSEEIKKNDNFHEYHYLKINDFKTYFSTGVIGGPNLSGLLDLNFFVDRPTVPRITFHKIVDHKINPMESNREGRNGSIRELQCGVILDLNTAKALYSWLGRHIDALEKISNEIKENDSNK